MSLLKTVSQPTKPKERRHGWECDQMKKIISVITFPFWFVYKMWFGRWDDPRLKKGSNK